MKTLLILIISLSCTIWSGFSWASKPCLDTHVRLVTAAGRMLDRKGITVNLRKKGALEVLGHKDTGINGNACVPYDADMKGGEEVEIFLGVQGQGWSLWRVLSPYKGLIYLPEQGKQRAPLEIVIAKKSLEIALMRYQTTNKSSTTQRGRFGCAYGQGRQYVQVIALRDKIKSELLLSSLRPKYNGCREEIIRRASSLFRVLVEKPANVSLERMCVDIRKNYIPTSKFKCKTRPL